jgi:hypothetical protein
VRPSGVASSTVSRGTSTTGAPTSRATARDRRTASAGTLATTSGTPGTGDPGLLASDPAISAPRNSSWSRPIEVMPVTIAGEHVRRVEPPAEADLDHGDVDADASEPLEREQRRELEVRELDAGRLERRRRSSATSATTVSCGIARPPRASARRSRRGAGDV